MRKVVVSEFITLDGVIQDPGGAEKFEHGGWNLPYTNDAEFGQYKFDELAAGDALLLGRVTYEGFAAAWPSITDEQGFADRMNSFPKYVVSTTLKAPLTWNNSHLIKENVAEAISNLKQQPGKDILIFGSGVLSHSLMQQNLIDEYHLQVHPVVLGSGARLFRDGSYATLKLVNVKPFPSGVVVLTYQPERKA